MNFAFENTSVCYAECDLSDVSVAVVGSEKKTLNIALASPLEVYSVSKFDDYEIVIYLPRFVYAGVKEYDVAGRVDVVTKNDVVIDSVPLLFINNAPEIIVSEKEKLSLFEKIKNKLKKDCR